MVATFVNAADGQEIELLLRGDFFGGTADIALGDRPVAQIRRKLFNAREVLTDNQTVRLVSFRGSPETYYVEADASRRT